MLVDPATSIEFPATLRIPSNITIPTMTLVGLGVRTVSFLGIKVYSVGFYADLENPNLKVGGIQSPSVVALTLVQISREMNIDDKIEHIVRNSPCVMRIGMSLVPLANLNSCTPKFLCGQLHIVTYAMRSCVRCKEEWL